MEFNQEKHMDVFCFYPVNGKALRAIDDRGGQML